jgi:single-stranded DNA-binding protein
VWERVRLAGRIGYAPKFRETAKGTLVGPFSLAVHEQPGETSWHSVVLFGARAEKLRESGFGKGDEVEVVGYPHEREKRNQKTGETKMVTEIYAAVVKRPKEKDKQ